MNVNNYRKKMKHAAVAFVALLLAGVAGNASAAIVTLDTVNAGYVQSQFTRDGCTTPCTPAIPVDPDTGTMVPFTVGAWLAGFGESPIFPAFSTVGENRTWAEFNLSTVTGPITGATLLMDLAGPANPPTQPVPGFLSDLGPETMVVTEYSGSLANLANPGATLATFQDLGDGGTGCLGTFATCADGDLGNTWGSRVVTAADMGTTLAFTLNPAAVADLEAKRLGGLNWAAGLFNSTISQADLIAGLDGEGLQSNQFSGATTNVAPPALQLTVSAVPIPAAAWLFGSGVVGLVGLGRRRSGAA